MPTTMARPKSIRDNNDDNNDLDTTVLDESSVSESPPEPGAFPISGTDRRRNSGSGIDASLEAGYGEPPVVHPRGRTALRNDDATSSIMLVEANLVTTSNGSEVLLVEGQAVVELSAAEWKRKQRHRFARILGLVLLAVGIAVGVTIWITSQRSNPQLVAPLTASPSQSLAPPFFAADDAAAVLFVAAAICVAVAAIGFAVVVVFIAAVIGAVIVPIIVADVSAFIKNLGCTTGFNQCCYCYWFSC